MLSWISMRSKQNVPCGLLVNLWEVIGSVNSYRWSLSGKSQLPQAVALAAFRSQVHVLSAGRTRPMSALCNSSFRHSSQSVPVFIQRKQLTLPNGLGSPSHWVDTPEVGCSFLSVLNFFEIWRIPSSGMWRRVGPWGTLRKTIFWFISETSGMIYDVRAYSDCTIISLKIPASRFSLGIFHKQVKRD